MTKARETGAAAPEPTAAKPKEQKQLTDLIVMGRIARLLEKLPDDQRRGTCAWLFARFGPQPTAPVAPGGAVQPQLFSPGS